MGLCWNNFMTIEKILRGNMLEMSRPFLNHSGIALGSFVDNLKIILGSFRDHPWIISRSFLSSYNHSPIIFTTGGFKDYIKMMGQVPKEPHLEGWGTSISKDGNQNMFWRCGTTCLSCSVSIVTLMMPCVWLVID